MLAHTIALKAVECNRREFEGVALFARNEVPTIELRANSPTEAQVCANWERLAEKRGFPCRTLFGNI